MILPCKVLYAQVIQASTLCFSDNLCTLGAHVGGVGKEGEGGGRAGTALQA